MQPETLKTAAGAVRCGGCRARFDALANLRDESFVIEAVRRTSSEEGRESWLRESAPRRGAIHAPGEMPDELREDMERHERRRLLRRRMLAGTGIALVLCLVLLLQAVWFHPEATRTNYPQTRDAVAWFCERTGCSLPERREPKRIRLVSHDVRVHPRYEGALQIRVRLVNDASFEQRYPRLRFSLFNVNGQIIGARTFTPREFLGHTPDEYERMPAGVPLDIALDLVAPEEAAVSFEFRFL